MKLRQLRWLIAGGAVGGLLLTAACDTPSKQRWLTFFFDGVPPLDNRTRAETKSVPDTKGETGQEPAAVVPASSGPFLHPPYRTRQCGGCHESAYSQKLRAPREEICLACHKGLLAALPLHHAPAGAGDCLACHDPHQSPEKHLLVRTGPSLCGYCHDPADWGEIPAHATAGEAACQSCHNPHGGAARFFLAVEAAKDKADAAPGEAP